MADPLDFSSEYEFATVDNQSVVRVLRGFEAPKLLSVGGRWTVVERPRRSSFIQWEGDDPYRMSVPILLDGFDTGNYVDASIETLVDMWQSSVSKKDPKEHLPPTPINITGALPVRGIKWVIESIEFGDNVIWTTGTDGKGHRLRQDATVNLLQYIEPDVAKVRSSSASFIYTTQPGDTLSKISNRWYGTPKLAGMLKKVNKIKDPKKLPKQMRIPPRGSTKPAKPPTAHKPAPKPKPKSTTHPAPPSKPQSVPPKKHK